MEVSIKKRIGIVPLFGMLVFAGIFLACGSGQSNATGNRHKDGIEDYRYEQKDEFAIVMQHNLAEMNKELVALAAIEKKASGEVKAEAMRKMKELRAKIDQLNRKIDTITNAAKPSWDTVKADFNRSYNDLRDTVDQVRTWLSEKVAP